MRSSFLKLRLRQFAGVTKRQPFAFSLAHRTLSTSSIRLSPNKNFLSFSSDDEQQLLNSLVSHPRRILRKVRLNVQCSAQRLATFRNLLTQIMVLIQNRLKALANDTKNQDRKATEHEHICRLLEMMIEECREFRCVDLAHLIFRAWIRFHGKYGLVISSEAILVLLDVAKRNLIMIQKDQNDSKMKSVQTFLETIALEMEKIPSLLELSFIPWCYLGNDQKLNEVKETIIAENGGLTANAYVYMAEGYGNMNKQDRVFSLLKECLNAKKIHGEDADTRMSLKELRARTITRMIEASVQTLTKTQLSSDTKSADKLPTEPTSPLHVIHRLVTFHLSHGYGRLSKESIAAIANVYLFRRNAKNNVSITSVKFCRHVNVPEVEKLLVEYCVPAKGFASRKNENIDENIQSWDCGMLGMRGLCALIAANGFLMKQKTSEVDTVMKSKVETLLTIIMQRMKGEDIDRQRTSDMVEGQHIIVCIRGLVSFNENEKLLELFRLIQGTCYKKDPVTNALSKDEFSSNTNLLNYDIYREFISAFGRLGDIRDVLYIKSQLEKDPVYGWEFAHTSYSFTNGKEHSSSSEALVNLYGTLLRIFRTSYPHHFRSIENELRDRKLRLSSSCYSALLEFYVIDRSDDAPAAYVANPDGGRGVSKRFHELTDEIDKRAAEGAPVWSPYLLKILIAAHTFTPLKTEDDENSKETSFRSTKAYSYIILAKRLGYTSEPFLQRAIVRFFLTHGCKDELRTFLTDIGKPSHEVTELCESDPIKAEVPAESPSKKTWNIPNIDICNSLIEYHGGDTFHKEALQGLLNQMETNKLAMNEQTFVLLIEIYGRWAEEEKLEGLLTRLNATTAQRVTLETAEAPVKQSLTLNLEIKSADDKGTKTVPFLLANDFALSATFFSTLAQAYNALGKSDHEIENVWENLLQTNLPVSSAAYNSFLDIFVNRMNFAQVEKILAVMMDKVPPNVLTLTTVIDLLGRMGQIEEMEKIFDEMMKSSKPTDMNAPNVPGTEQNSVSCFPTTVTFHHMMGAYAKRGDVFKMLGILEKMKENDIPQTVISYNILVSGYCRAKQFNKVKEIIEERKRKFGSDIDIITSIVWLKSLGLCQLEEELKVVEAQVHKKKWLTDKRVKTSFKLKLLHTLSLAYKHCHNTDRAIHYAKTLLSDTYSSKITFFYISSVLKIYCSLNQDDLIDKFTKEYITLKCTRPPVESAEGDWESSCFDLPKKARPISMSHFQVSALANIILQHYCRVKMMNKVEDILKRLAKEGIKFTKGKESIELSSYVLELKSHKQKEVQENAAHDVSSEIDALFSKPGEDDFSEKTVQPE